MPGLLTLEDRQGAPRNSGRLEPLDLSLELKAQLRAFVLGQPVRHLRKDGSVKQDGANDGASAMRVFKLGHSLAVRLPKALVDRLGLERGDELSIVAANMGVIQVETKEDQRRRAVDQLASLNWTLPPDYKFDRNEANER